MKRLFFAFAVAVLLPLPALHAQQAAKPASKAELVRLTQHAKRHHDYLSAMVSATLLLTQDENNSFAKNFVHDNWGAMMQQVDDIVAQNSDMADVEQCVARTNAYSQLAEVERNINSVTMPLRGNGWQWQPEMLYTAGTYQSERLNLSRLLREQASQALRSYDADQLRLCYDRLLSTNLLFDDERESNRRLLLADCNKRLAEVAAAKDKLAAADSLQLSDEELRRRRRLLNDLLFADELTQLSLTLDDSQDDIRQLQADVRSAVRTLYLQLADHYLQQGDTLQADVYRSAAVE